MRLSEAILLGSTMLKPMKERIFTDSEHGCAIGMGLTAIGYAFDSKTSEESYFGVWGVTKKTWPWLENVYQSALPCGCNVEVLSIGGPLDETCYMAIGHFFDKHVYPGSWTIEQLVDWVRSIEPAEKEEAHPIESTEAVTV